MIANRSDAWTPDDDMLLAETVLRHIREGSSQLNAFDEVAEKLGRTSGACGFRWNATVRKNYESAIQIAKAQRHQAKSKKNKKVYNLKRETETVPSLPSQKEEMFQQLNYDTVINFLKSQKGIYQDVDKKIRSLEKELKEKIEENNKLKEVNERLKKDYASSMAVSEDYKALLQIMERARRLAVLGTEREEAPIFKMDPNGNLERFAK